MAGRTEELALSSFLVYQYPVFIDVEKKRHSIPVTSYACNLSCKQAIFVANPYISVCINELTD